MARLDGIGQHGHLVRAFGYLRDIAVEFMRGETPGLLKAVVTLAFFGGPFALLLAVPFAYIGDDVLASYALWGGLGVIVTALVICLVWSVLALRNSPSTRVAKRREPTWTRLVPKLPISADTMGDLVDRLRTVRGRAFEAIQKEFGLRELQVSQVRANIFLPDMTKLGTWGGCRLHIPDRLQVGMDSPEEQQIRFWPGQGLTGTVFTSQRPQPARFDPTAGAGERDWHSKFGLTDDQRRRLHPDLKWIISFPLKVQDGDRQRTMGVLNVDGLGHELTDRQLRVLLGTIIDEVLKLTGVLKRHAKQRVSVIVENENG